MLEFDIKYVTQKSMKGKAIANHLAHCSLEVAEEIQGDFPDEDIVEIEVEFWSSFNFSRRDTHSIFWQTQFSCHQQCHRI